MTGFTDTDRALAFAGILQALKLVQDTAYGRPLDASSLRASLGSVLTIDTPSVASVFGDVSGARSGLELLVSQFTRKRQNPDIELSRYLVTLLHLERKLSKRSDLLDRVRSGVERLQQQLEHFEIDHPNIIASLADIYAQTVSTLRPRIMVNGDPQRLADAAVANRIRALLLAAMRAAVLWRQCGGTRVGLLLGRGKLVKAASEALAGK
jgi:high frequency lysogenization protein